MEEIRRVNIIKLTTQERYKYRFQDNDGRYILVFDTDEEKLYLGEKVKGEPIFTEASSGGGAGSFTYTNATPTPSSIGGISAGTTFSNVPLEQILDSLLYPYLPPAFTSFAISGQTSPLETGDSIVAGNKTFTWATSNSANVQANSIAIVDVTSGSVNLASALANDGNEIINFASPIQKTVAGSHIWQVRGTNSLAASFTRNYTVNWQWRMYWGFYGGTTIDSANVLLLGSSKLASTFAGNVTMPVNGGTNYIYFVFADSWGSLTSLQDVTNGFNAFGDFTDMGTISHNNQFGINMTMRVIRSINPTGGGSGFIYNLG